VEKGGYETWVEKVTVNQKKWDFADRENIGELLRKYIGIGKIDNIVIRGWMMMGDLVNCFVKLFRLSIV